MLILITSPDGRREVATVHKIEDVVRPHRSAINEVTIFTHEGDARIDLNKDRVELLPMDVD